MERIERRGIEGGDGFLWRPKWSLVVAVITRAKEIKNGTKTRISEKRKKTEKWKKVYVKEIEKGRRSNSQKRRERADGERDILWCARVSVILPSG